MSRPCQIIDEESVFAGSIVRLLVGKSVCPLSVHFRLLRARSPFFECLLADWSDSDDEPVQLPDTEAEVFEQFLGWLYTDCIDVRRKNGEWLGLCKLWVLAETFQVPSLQNRVVEAFSARLYRKDMLGLDLKVLEYVYNETASPCLLRSIFVYISVWFGNVDGFADLTSELPHEFHTDYALQRVKKARMEGEGGLEGDAWDLTRFFVKEGCGADAEPSLARKEGGREKTLHGERRDSVTEETRRKRKKSC